MNAKVMRAASMAATLPVGGTSLALAQTAPGGGGSGADNTGGSGSSGGGSTGH